jgi:hypothetical protein
MEVYIVYTSVVEDFIDGLDRFCAFNYYLQGKVSKGDVLTVPPYGRYLLSIYLKNERLVMFEVPLSYLNIAFSNMQRGALMTHDLVGYDQFNFKRAVNAQMLKSKFAAS